MGHRDSRVTEQTYIHPYDEQTTAERFRGVIATAMREQAGLAELGAIASPPSRSLCRNDASASRRPGAALHMCLAP